MSNGSGFVDNVYPVRFAHPGKCDAIIYIKLKLKGIVSKNEVDNIELIQQLINWNGFKN